MSQKLLNRINELEDRIAALEAALAALSNTKGSPKSGRTSTGK